MWCAGFGLLLCTLDQTCLHLLAKLNALGISNAELGYGTKIVSFQNQDDLIDCFTKLQLISVNQSEVGVVLPQEIVERFLSDRTSSQGAIQKTSALDDKLICALREAYRPADDGSDNKQRSVEDI